MKKLILILGAPGSGKTTDALLVAKHHANSITSYSLGDLLKDDIKKGTTIGKINNGYISKGELVPTAIVIDAIFAAIDKSPTDIVILDGFPREEDQMKIFADILFNRKDKIELVSVIELRVSEEVARERVLGDEMTADDDKKDIFSRSMKIYKDAITDIETFYKDKNLLKVIDAEREMDAIVADIDTFLEQKIDEIS